MLKLFIMFFSIVSCFVHNVNATETITLPINAKHFDLRPYSQYYIDTTEHKGIEDIVQLTAQFTPLTEKKFTPFPIRTWIKTPLKNQSNKSQTWFLYTGLLVDTEIKAYLKNSHTQKLILSLDEQSAFRERPVQEGQLLIPIQLSAGESTTLYLQYKTRGNLPIAMEAFHQEMWQEFSTTDKLFNGFIFGILLCSFTFIVLQLLLKPTRSSIYLLLFIVSGFFLVADTSGYIQQYFWPNQLEPVKWVTIVIIMLPLIFYFTFIAHTLRLKRIASYLYYVYFSIILSASLISVASPFFELSLAIYVLSPLSFVAIFFTIYVVLSRQLPLSKLYVSSLLFHVFFMNILVMLNFHSDVIPLIHTHSFTTMKLGFVIEVILFITLFTYRSKIAKHRYEKINLLHQKQKLEKELAFERIELMSELVEKKNKLLADVSHELRTPLTVLKLQVESLQHNLDDDVEASYQALDEKLSDIGRLISDIYQLAKSDIGALGLNFCDLEFPETITSWTNEFELLVTSNNLTWQFNNQLDSPVTINADEDRIKQILSNLINNSVKYTDNCGVVILSVSANEHELFIIIEDSSPSVPTELQSQIFERLYRVEESRSRQTGGSGLGLAICKSLVEAHNGIITANTSNQGGLKVIVQLPIISKH